MQTGLPSLAPMNKNFTQTIMGRCKIQNGALTAVHIAGNFDEVFLHVYRALGGLPDKFYQQHVSKAGSIFGLRGPSDL